MAAGAEEVIDVEKGQESSADMHKMPVNKIGANDEVGSKLTLHAQARLSRGGAWQMGINQQTLLVRLDIGNGEVAIIRVAAEESQT